MCDKTSEIDSRDIKDTKIDSSCPNLCNIISLSPYSGL
jgi:hypothetical protein